MTPSYFAQCGCGKRFSVELFEAGSKKNCPGCGAVVIVPSSFALQEQAGDEFPLLPPLQKIAALYAAGKPPFDGLCQRCGDRDAEFRVPISINVLKERAIADDAPIQATLTGGIKFVAGAAEEQWETTRFPLLLCSPCMKKFKGERRLGKAWRWAKTLFVVGLLAGFLVFAWFNAHLVAALAGGLSLVAAIAYMFSLGGNRKYEPVVARWLEHVRWAPEALAEEEEFEIHIGEAEPVATREVV